MQKEIKIQQIERKFTRATKRANLCSEVLRKYFPFGWPRGTRLLWQRQNGLLMLLRRKQSDAYGMLAATQNHVITRWIDLEREALRFSIIHHPYLQGCKSQFQPKALLQRGSLPLLSSDDFSFLHSKLYSHEKYVSTFFVTFPSHIMCTLLPQ